jgi:hypothetical protein
MQPTDSLLRLLEIDGLLQGDKVRYYDLNTGELLYDRAEGVDLLNNQVFLAAALSATNAVDDFIEQLTLSRKIGKHQVNVGVYGSHARANILWFGDAVLASLDPVPRFN